MSVHQSNIAMLRAVSKRLDERGRMALERAKELCGDDDDRVTEEGVTCLVLGALSAVCRDAANDLERQEQAQREAVASE